MENQNTETTQGAEKSVPFFTEKIGDMNYQVSLHFKENGAQTLQDKLKRVILQRAEAKIS